MAIRISAKVAAKLEEKHGVSEREVIQCFENLCGLMLVDTREENRTDPPTLWFIAPTNQNRLLKVCFIHRDGVNIVKTCFPPNADELRIYRKHGAPKDF